MVVREGHCIYLSIYLGGEGGGGPGGSLYLSIYLSIYLGGEGGGGPGGSVQPADAAPLHRDQG